MARKAVWGNHKAKKRTTSKKKTAKADADASKKVTSIKAAAKNGAKKRKAS